MPSFNIADRIETGFSNDYMGNTGGQFGNGFLWNKNRLQEISPLFINEKEYKIGDKAYRIVVKQENKELFKQDFENTEDFNRFMNNEGLSRKAVNPFIACLIPVRTDTVTHFAKDFFLPTTFNQLQRVKKINIVSIAAGIGALLLDCATLPVRFFTAFVSRTVFNTKEQSLHAILKDKYPNLKLDDYVEIHVIGWKVLGQGYYKPNKIREEEIGYRLYFEEHPDDGCDPYMISEQTIESDVADYEKLKEKIRAGKEKLEMELDLLDRKDKSAMDFMGLKTGFEKKELEKAFRKKSVKMHPDHGGNEDQYKTLVKYRDLLLEKLEKEKIA